MRDDLAKQLHFRSPLLYLRTVTYRYINNIRITVLSVLLTATASVWLAREWIEHDTKGRILHSVTDMQKRRVGLVLGCARNLYFFHRVNAATELFHAGKIEYILVSGDNHIATYNEAGAMKAALVQRGVPADRIFCDYAGFSTIDSVVRAQAIFGQNRITIISQKFHVQRAVFIAKRKQIDAIGFCAEDVPNHTGWRTHLREQLARVKTILDLYVLKRQPVYLGEPLFIGDIGYFSVIKLEQA